MSTRKTSLEATGANPSKVFYSWKSNEKCFEYYDKVEGEKVEVALPFRFIFLDKRACVKGWHDASESGIYSNEVANTTKTELTVRSFKGGELVKGIYKAVKGDILAVGGKFHQSIYIQTPEGDISNIQIKGAAMMEWGNFEKENKKKFVNHWIEVKDVIKGKKGAVTFFSPKFNIGDPLTEAEDGLAETAYTTLQEYFTEYDNRKPKKETTDEESTEEPSEEFEDEREYAEEEDGLDF